MEPCAGVDLCLCNREVQGTMLAGSLVVCVWKQVSLLEANVRSVSMK